VTPFSRKGDDLLLKTLSLILNFIGIIVFIDYISHGTPQVPFPQQQKQQAIA
jgi:hypothetical protein